MKFKTAFLLSFAIACSSVGQGAVFEGLVVRGDHKKLPVFVAVGGDTDIITTDEVMRAVKLRCLANGITTSEWKSFSSPHVLNVYVLTLEDKIDEREIGFSALVRMSLQKTTRYYVSKPQYIGSFFEPEQSDYGSIVSLPQDGKSYLIDIINQSLDKFLLDYLESNIAERRKIKKTQAQGSGK